jgi:serine/threonine-protein kinase
MQKALAKHPDHRFQTAAEFAEALYPFGASAQQPGSVQSPAVPLMTAVAPAPPVVPAAAPVAVPAPPLVPPHAIGPASRPRQAANLVLLVGVAATFLVVGVLLAVVVMRLVVGH